MVVVCVCKCACVCVYVQWSIGQLNYCLSGCMSLNRSQQWGGYMLIIPPTEL